MVSGPIHELHHEESVAAAGMRVVMLAPDRNRCGISDYSRHLIDALRALPEIAGVDRIDPEPSATLGKQIQDHGAQIVHIQHQYFFFGGVAPHKNRVRALYNALTVPAVLTVHEIAEERGGLLRRRLTAFANRQNFLHPALRRYIVHTDVDRKRLAEIGVSPERIAVIPVGIPPAEPLPERGAAKAALELTGKRVVTLFGFLSRKKGHQVAIEALAALPEAYVLLLAGDRHPDDQTDYVPSLKARIAEMGLQDRVKITGYLPEERLPQMMAATDVAIAPFLETSGSASLAHLLAYGLPVVASNIPPLQQIEAEAPGCLLLTEVGNSTALRDGIVQVCEGETLRTRMREASYLYAELHSYKRMAQATAAVYQQALQAGT